MSGDFLLFVYGVLMTGEPRHELLVGARSLGPIATEPTFDLVDLGAEPALIAGGTTAVRGELYAISPAGLAAVDLHHGHPLRYKRGPIALEGGRVAEAHLITSDQARGKRRIRSGDWRTRLSARAADLPDRPWSRFARERGKLPR